MAPIRVHTTVEADGELHLRGLPVQKGQHAEVIILPEGADSDAVLSILREDPGWAWLRDDAEDVYSEQDAR